MNKNFKQLFHLGDLGTDTRIILKWLFKTQDWGAGARAGLFRNRLVTSSTPVIMIMNLQIP